MGRHRRGHHRHVEGGGTRRQRRVRGIDPSSTRPGQRRGGDGVRGGPSRGTFGWSLFIRDSIRRRPPDDDVDRPVRRTRDAAREHSSRRCHHPRELDQRPARARGRDGARPARRHAGRRGERVEHATVSRVHARRRRLTLGRASFNGARVRDQSWRRLAASRGDGRERRGGDGGDGRAGPVHRRQRRVDTRAARRGSRGGRKRERHAGGHGRRRGAARLGGGSRGGSGGDPAGSGVALAADQPPRARLPGRHGGAQGGGPSRDAIVGSHRHLRGRVHRDPR